MQYSVVEELFYKFSQNTDKPLSRISEFINGIIKPQFYKEKQNEYSKKGFPREESNNKTRQGWVSFIGRILEGIVEKSLEGFCKEYDLKMVNDRQLKKSSLTSELDLVRRAIEVHFDDYSLLPDADIILYRYYQSEKRVEILTILSIKNSFRERYTETPYWKLKLGSNLNTKSIKVFMITPDNDNEISSGQSGVNNPRKARIVMEYELDGIYLAKEDFDPSKKVKGISDLEKDLKQIILT